jgi:hypothetical protein
MSKQQAVETIAEKVGLLRPCRNEICDELTLDEEQLESAYHYAAKVFKNNDPLTKDFKTQKELTDRIKNLSEIYDTECACDRLLAKD